MTDTLFQLIKSLTPGEKRYFKLYAAKQSETKKTNYEKLFDQFNELPDNESYDEEKFIKKLRQKNLGKYFSDDKNYLTQLILKAMRSYASEKKADVQLADMIQEMNFLMLKGLMDHCERICDKAWEIAEERELTEQKVRLLAIRRIIDRSEYKTSRLNYQNELRMQEDEALAQLTDEREAAYLYEHIYCFYVMHRLADQKVSIDRIFERLDLLQDKNGLTFECLDMVIRTKCVILDYRSLHDPDNTDQYLEALKLLRQLITQWEQSPWRIREMTHRYVKSLGNFFIFSMRAASYEEMVPLIKKLDAIQTSEKQVLKEIFYLKYCIMVSNHFVLKQYHECLYFIPEIQEGLKKYGVQLNFVQKRTLYTNICMIYLKNKMYPEVLDAVQDVYMLVGRDKEKQNRIEDMRLYEFIAHYELGNIDLLHYAVRNNQRFFKEHKPDNNFLASVWKLLKQFAEDSSATDAAKQKLKTAIEPLQCLNINAALKRELIQWLDGSY